MSVIGELFKARDKPRNSLNGSGYSFLFGNTVAGKTVDERSAMQMSAGYACVRILSEAIAALSLHFYQYNAAGGKEKALRHPLYNLLHDEPNPEMTAFSFRETIWRSRPSAWVSPATSTVRPSIRTTHSRAAYWSSRAWCKPPKCVRDSRNAIYQRPHCRVDQFAGR